jgi:hypothetical protein
MNRLVIAVLAGTAGLLAAGIAHANCAPVVDALEKASRQARLAQYDIDSRDQPLTGKPVLVRIGKVLYDGFGGDYERTEIDGADPMLQALRRAVREGRARCETAGTDTWRGAAATRVRFDNPMAPKQYNPTTMWIAKSTGLPVYHEINGLGPGGFAWVYGDAVSEPAVKK